MSDNAMILTATEKSILSHLLGQPGARCHWDALRTARPKGITTAGWSRIMNRLGDLNMIGRDYAAVYLTFAGARALKATDNAANRPL